MPILGNEILRGDLVRFARLQRTDCADLERWWQDIGFQRNLRRGEIELTSAEEFEGWLFGKHDGWEESHPFALRTLAEDKLIGMIEINRVMRQARHCMFWIAIGDPDYRGRGYGSDALRVLFRFAFLEMNLNRVGLEVMSYNSRAIASYEKLGFVREGVQREVVYRDGNYYDIIGMGILRREWEARYWQG